MYQVRHISPFSHVTCEFCDAASDTSPKGMYLASLTDNNSSDGDGNESCDDNSNNFNAPIIEVTKASINSPMTVCANCCDKMFRTGIVNHGTRIYGHTPIFVGYPKVILTKND